MADFDQHYHSYPLSHISKTNHETGNKIIMPASALDQLASLTVAYPMLFRIQNPATGCHSHCGVVEFTAEEGFVFMPTWMMNNMQLQEGQLVNIKNISLPKGTYLKIQPHATKFTTLSDHKSLLENAFRDFVCVTTGDTIVVNHGDDEKYMVDIVETKPSPAILLFETDCVVDFAQPLDYNHKSKTTADGKRKSGCEDDEGNMKKDSKVVFPGTGTRLGRTKIEYDKCLFATDLLTKKLKTTTVVVDGKMEFKPFTGVARRVDGQTLVAEAEEIVQQDQSRLKVDDHAKEYEGFKAFTGKSYRLL